MMFANDKSKYEKFYLYNKNNQKIVATFSSKYSVKKYIEECMKYIKRPSTDLIIRPSQLAFGDMPLNLSMDFNPPADYDLFSTVWLRDGHKEYVILDYQYKVFNYCEIVNEIIANDLQIKIKYGENYTYQKIEEKEIERPICYRYGYKTHGKGSGSYKLKVGMAERVSCYDISYSDIKELADEYNLYFPALQKAFKCMRGDRKSRAFSGWLDYEYTDHYEKYGRPISWKKQKKKHQWE